MITYLAKLMFFFITRTIKIEILHTKNKNTILSLSKKYVYEQNEYIKRLNIVVFCFFMLFMILINNFITSHDTRLRTLAI